MAAAVLALVAGGLAHADDCGAERWAVKVGADTAAQRVDLAHPRTITPEELRAIHRPTHVGNNSERVRGVEDQAFVVEGILTAYRSERDGDTHLIITGTEAGSTFIAEIPSPDCMPANSPFFRGADRARADFAARFARRAGSGLQVRVRVTGPAFFDFRHRQSGVAPNAIEIHPVTRVEFLADRH